MLNNICATRSKTALANPSSDSEHISWDQLLSFLTVYKHKNRGLPDRIE